MTYLAKSIYFKYTQTHFIHSSLYQHSYLTTNRYSCYISPLLLSMSKLPVHLTLTVPVTAIDALRHFETG